MSISSLHSTIKQLETNIAAVNKKLSDAMKKESDNLSKIASVNNSINKNTSISTLQSKQRQIDSHNKNIYAAKKEQAELTKKLSDHQSKLADARQRLFKEEARERDELAKKQQAAIDRQFANINNLTARTPWNSNASFNHTETEAGKNYDFFISHATEDKNDIAIPLYHALKNRGAEVWFDEFEMTVGDSLRKSIDRGLANSKHGIVILSKIYMSKFWTGVELNALFQKWANADSKVILPIWHNITKTDVERFSPMLLDILAFKSADLTIDEMADGFMDLIKPIE